MLDGLTLGEATGAQPGPATAAPCALALVAVLALATGTAVAQDRPDRLRWPGCAPHLVRCIVQTPTAGWLLLGSLMGGLLLMAADTLAVGCWRRRNCRWAC